MELNGEMTNEEAIEWLVAIEEKYIRGGDEGFDNQRRAALHLARNALALIKQLTEENERLKEILHTDISFVRVSRGSGKTNHLREVARLRMDAVRADTVREMQERFTKEFDRMHKSNFLTVEVRQWIIDQIAKEMLEGDDA